MFKYFGGYIDIVVKKREKWSLFFKEDDGFKWEIISK